MVSKGIAGQMRAQASLHPIEKDFLVADLRVSSRRRSDREPQDPAAAQRVFSLA